MSLKRATLGDSTSSEDVIATFQSIGLAHYKNSAFAYEDEFGQALSAYEEVFKEQKKSFLVRNFYYVLQSTASP